MISSSLPASPLPPFLSLSLLLPSLLPSSLLSFLRHISCSNLGWTHIHSVAEDDLIFLLTFLLTLTPYLPASTSYVLGLRHVSPHLTIYLYTYFNLEIIYFMYVGVLSACLCTMCVKYPLGPEEGAGCPGTSVAESCKIYGVLGLGPRSPGSSQCS